MTTYLADRVPLPRDWQEVRLVRVLPSKGVLRYNTPDAFFNPEFPDDPDSKYPGQDKRYTIVGNFLFVGGSAAPGIEVEMTYYQDIPPLTDDANNWANYYHPTLYTFKILHIAALYAVDDERIPVWNLTNRSLGQPISIITHGASPGQRGCYGRLRKAAGDIRSDVRPRSYHLQEYRLGAVPIGDCFLGYHNPLRDLDGGIGRQLAGLQHRYHL
jgi:hypothetical protein